MRCHGAEQRRGDRGGLVRSDPFVKAIRQYGPDLRFSSSHARGLTAITAANCSVPIERGQEIRHSLACGGNRDEHIRVLGHRPPGPGLTGSVGQHCLELSRSPMCSGPVALVHYDDVRADRP